MDRPLNPAQQPHVQAYGTHGSASDAAMGLQPSITPNATRKSATSTVAVVNLSLVVNLALVAAIALALASTAVARARVVYSPQRQDLPPSHYPSCTLQQLSFRNVQFRGRSPEPGRAVQA